MSLQFNIIVLGKRLNTHVDELTKHFTSEAEENDISSLIGIVVAIVVVLLVALIAMILTVLTTKLRYIVTKTMYILV